MIAETTTPEPAAEVAGLGCLMNNGGRPIKALRETDVGLGSCGLGGAARLLAWALVVAGTALAVVAADLVRLHWARSEMRNLVAAAALAAATELDGTAAGLLRAREAAEAVWKRSLIATAVAKGAEADFGLSPTGPWRGEPGDLTRCCFVRVRAAGAVPLSLLPLLGRASARFVEAEAIAVPRLPPLGQAEPDGEADPVSPRLLTISVGSGRAVGAP